MFSTAVILSVVLGSIILSLILWAMFLRFGLRWAKANFSGNRRIVVATVLVAIFQLFNTAVFAFVLNQENSNSIVYDVLELVISLMVPIAILGQLFRLSILRSFQAWLPTLIPSLLMIVAGVFVIRSFVCVGYMTPSNSMAPTILAESFRGTCPVCGEPTYVTNKDHEVSQRSRTPVDTICNRYHVTPVTEVSKHTLEADRFLVSVFLSPRRWDIAAFDNPMNPATSYIKRVVGLPGETIHIESGTIHVNGQPIEVPESLAGIQYWTDEESRREESKESEMWGTVARPAILGPDEYFVLGDFSKNSLDSRWWTNTTTGRSPFAVPAESIHGVVTHIYWPPERWRILR